jgi:hypothetical protein
MWKATDYLKQCEKVQYPEALLKTTAISVAGNVHVTADVQLDYSWTGSGLTARGKEGDSTTWPGELSFQMTVTYARRRTGSIKT